MIRILHLSDLHFHRSESDNVTILTTLEQIASNYPQHHILITGDITDDGHETQYQNAQSALERFRGRLSLVPGNHDYGPFGNFYDETCATLFDRYLAIPFQNAPFAEGSVPIANTLETASEKVLLIGLNSTLRTVAPFDFACGEVGGAQRAMLAELLSNPANQDCIKIVALHHHPLYHHPFFRLLDGDDLMRIVVGRIEVLAFGHKHVAALWPGGAGIPWIVAAENSSGRATVREIAVEKRRIEVRDVPVGISP
jgi:3',5'-cyclic AMP phosphodiesterase CpdA